MSNLKNPPTTINRHIAPGTIGAAYVAEAHAAALAADGELSPCECARCMEKSIGGAR